MREGIDDTVGVVDRMQIQTHWWRAHLFKLQMLQKQRGTRGLLIRDALK